MPEDSPRSDEPPAEDPAKSHHDSDQLRAQFDRIVEGIDLRDIEFDESAFAADKPSEPPSDFSGPTATATMLPGDAPGQAPGIFGDEDAADEQFYRQVPPLQLRARDVRTTVAFSALIGSPVLLVICTVANIWLPRSIVVGAGLIFAAAAIWLIYQLPARGPALPDEPDDGAVL